MSTSHFSATAIPRSFNAKASFSTTFVVTRIFPGTQLIPSIRFTLRDHNLFSPMSTNPPVVVVVAAATAADIVVVATSAVAATVIVAVFVAVTNSCCYCCCHFYNSC